jgi:hypothetical protein
MSKLIDMKLTRRWNVTPSKRLFLASPAAILAVSLAALAQPAFAAPIQVTSYAMNNGNTGAYNYRDFTYLPCPGNACDTTGAALSGGTGKLTDGIIPFADWYQQGELTQWVGWDGGQGSLNPTVTFNFNGTQVVNQVTIWISNSLTGGVAQPGSIGIGGTTFIIPPDNVDSTPHALTFTGLNEIGSSLSLQFFQPGGVYSWAMIGEVSFDGVPIPEPATLAVFGTFAAAFGLLRQRRRLPMAAPGAIA